VDSWPVVALVPKVVHALLASALDFAVFVAAKRQFGLTPARISLGLWLTNWFTLYCGTRSFSNNLESCLTLLGISGLFRVREGVAFPPRPRWWQFGRGIEWCLAALSCYIRPTSLLIWIPVALLTAVREPFRLPSAIALGALTVALCVSFDSWMYGSLTVPAWNFVKFNGIYNVARLYGTHSWHWYVSQGIPMAVGVQLPLLALSIVTSLTFCNLPHCRASLALFGLSCLYVGCMSTIGHKEARFLLPVLPFLAMATGAGVYHAWKRCEHAVVPSAGAKPLHKLVGWLTRNVRGLCALGVLVNVGVAVFLCNFHQVGTCCTSVSLVQWLNFEWLVVQRGAVAATETLGNIAQVRALWAHGLSLCFP
jgi:GPI mannosyltransferase 3